MHGHMNITPCNMKKFFQTWCKQNNNHSFNSAYNIQFKEKEQKLYSSDFQNNLS